MLYLIQQGTDGPFKIGYTASSSERRMYALQTGNPIPLRLIGTLEGSLQDESGLHQQFEHVRLHNEWFKPVPEILAVFENGLAPTASVADECSGAMNDELIALRLSKDLLDRLDGYVEELQRTEPRFQITRCSAIRDLIARLPIRRPKEKR